MRPRKKSMTFLVEIGLAFCSRLMYDLLYLICCQVECSNPPLYRLFDFVALLGTCHRCLKHWWWRLTVKWWSLFETACLETTISIEFGMVNYERWSPTMNKNTKMIRFFGSEATFFFWTPGREPPPLKKQTSFGFGLSVPFLGLKSETVGKNRIQLLHSTSTDVLSRGHAGI